MLPLFVLAGAEHNVRPEETRLQRGTAVPIEVVRPAIGRRGGEENEEKWAKDGVQFIYSPEENVNYTAKANKDSHALKLTKENVKFAEWYSKKIEVYSANSHPGDRRNLMHFEPVTEIFCLNTNCCGQIAKIKQKCATNITLQKDKK